MEDPTSAAAIIVKPTGYKECKKCSQLRTSNLDTCTTTECKSTDGELKMINEVHLVKGESVLLKFRSQDVIHSAYLPHFRVQMNCVPGMTTQFAFTPTQTTADMKEQEGEDFEFILLCNKICGTLHYNMQMRLIVETQEEHEKWLENSEQETLSGKLLTQN
jgi:heme/copper-type cytochrome/quinol oxidase subunit 2